MTNSSLNLLVRQIRMECEGVVSLELERADGSPLPAFTAGAHIDVCVPGGFSRSYSLLDPPGQHSAWRIAIKEDRASRGASRWFHHVVRVGMTLEARLPDNEFVLAQTAAHSVLIAGGIGITPLLSMIGHLTQSGRSWELHYACSTAATMPFQGALERFAAQGNGIVRRHISSEARTRMDLLAIVGDAAGDAHLYCCGPAGMIDDFLAASASRDHGTVHYERFSSSQVAATEGGFSLQLARDGRLLQVPAGKSILDVLLDAGLDIPYSCTQGVCGTCRLPVLDGVPEHRDDFLSEEERAANDSVAACCSGSRTALLTLDV